MPLIFKGLTLIQYAHRILAEIRNLNELLDWDFIIELPIGDSYLL